MVFPFGNQSTASWTFMRSSCPHQMGKITVHFKWSVREEMRKPTHSVSAALGKGQCRGPCEAGVWPHNSAGGVHRTTSQIFTILYHKVKFLKGENGGQQQAAEDSRAEDTLWNSILKALKRQFLIQLLILCQEARVSWLQVEIGVLVPWAIWVFLIIYYCLLLLSARSRSSSNVLGHAQGNSPERLEPPRFCLACTSPISLHLCHSCGKQHHHGVRDIPGGAVMGIHAVHPGGSLCACRHASMAIDGVQSWVPGKVHDVVLVVHVDALPGWDDALWRGRHCHSLVWTLALLSAQPSIFTHTLCRWKTKLVKLRIDVNSLN